MVNVGDVFMNKGSNTMLRVLSYTGQGFDQSCYCILEKDRDCWDGYYSALYIETYYTKLEGL